MSLRDVLRKLFTRQVIVTINKEVSAKRSGAIKTSPRRNTRTIHFDPTIHRFDLWVIPFVWMPLIVGSLFVLRQESFVEGALGVMSIVIGIAIFFGTFGVVPSTAVLYRQFTGKPQLFSDCRAFQFPGLTRQVYLPRDIQKIKTAPAKIENINAPNALISSVGQDDLSHRDYQIIEIHLAFSFDFKRAATVIQMFLDEYTEINSLKTLEEMEESPSKQMLDFLLAWADEFLQKQTMAAVISDKADLNPLLTKRLRDSYAEFGVFINNAAIANEDDTHPNGYVANLKRKNAMRQKTEADQRVAEYEATARKVQATQNREAAEKEQEERGKIADAELAALKKVIETQRQAAQIGQQTIIAQLEAVKDREVQIFASNLAHLSPEQFTAFLSKLAENLGMKPTTLVNVGGSLLEGHPVTAWCKAGVEIFKQMFKTTQAP